MQLLKNVPNVAPQSLFSVTRVIHVPTNLFTPSVHPVTLCFFSSFYLWPADKSTTMAAAAADGLHSTPFRLLPTSLFSRCYYLCTVHGTRHSIIFSSIFIYSSPPVLMSGCPQVQVQEERRDTVVPPSGKLRSGRTTPFRSAHMQM